MEKTILEMVLLVFAAVIFIRGMFMLFAPTWTKKFFIRIIKKNKGIYGFLGIAGLVAGLAIFWLELARVDFLDIIIILLASAMFLSSWILLVARKKCLELWVSLFAISNRLIVLLGIAHVIVALIILYLISL